MHGSTIEVLELGPPDSEEFVAPSRWARPRRTGVATLAVVLLVGLGAGAWAEHRLLADPAQPIAAQPIAAQPRINAVAVVVVPAGGAVTPSPATGGVASEIDVAVTNAGDVPLAQVVSSWQTIKAPELIVHKSVAPVGSLGPGASATVHLHLWRPCRAGADLPTLLLSWTGTGTGAPARLAVSPVGLDRLWAALAAACPPRAGAH